MNREDALDLAKRVANCWWGGPPVTEWADYLCGLDDPDRAGQVFLRFRGQLENPPTFKRFADEYRALAHTTPAPVVVEVGPRLSREERMKLLTAAGAPRKLLTKENP